MTTNKRQESRRGIRKVPKISKAIRRASKRSEGRRVSRRPAKKSPRLGQPVSTEGMKAEDQNKIILNAVQAARKTGTLLVGVFHCNGDQTQCVGFTHDFPASHFPGVLDSLRKFLLSEKQRLGVEDI